MVQGIKSIAINASYLAMARTITSFARIFYAIVLAKYLGPQIYGMFNYGMSWYLIFMPISTLGLDAILIREIGRGKQLKIINQTLTLRIISSILVSSVYCTLGYFVESNSVAKLVILIFSFAIIGRTMSLWLNSLFTAYETSVYVFQFEVVFRLLEVGLGIIALLLGGGLIEIAIIHAATWCLQGICGFYLFQKKYFGLSLCWEPHAFLSVIKKGFYFIISGFLIVWFLQGGIFTIRAQDGFGMNLGIYALAIQALIIIGGISAEFGNAAIPVLSRSIDRNDGKGAYYIDTVLRGGIVLGGILTIGGLTIGQDIIQWVFGNPYILVADLLPWELLLVIPFFIMTSLNSVTISIGDYRKLNSTAFFGFLTYSIILYPFYILWGMFGIVWATGLGLVLVNIGQLLFLKKYYFISITKAVVHPVTIIVISIFLALNIVIFNQWAAMLFSIFFLLFMAFKTGVINTKEKELFLNYFRLKL